MDEQYHAQGVIPDTANPQSARKVNSVRIYLPITRDSDAFEFEL